MIATLNGKISEKLQETIVIDVNGMGYGILVSAEDYQQLKPGTSQKLYIYEHIRENAHDLFGFLKTETKTLFELLLAVNGVGPRMALNILNTGSIGEVSRAISAGDVKLIQSANGVGKKVAERVVLDLKDKVGLPVSVSSEDLLLSSNTLKKDDAVQALIALGFSLPDALNALKPIDRKLPTELRVKKALSTGL